MTTEYRNNWPNQKIYWVDFSMRFEINEFIRKKKKKKKKILNAITFSYFVLSFGHSVHTFVVYRSIAAMYKLINTPHGEHRTFNAQMTSDLFTKSARYLFIGGKFEKLLLENLNKVFSISPHKKKKKKKKKKKWKIENWIKFRKLNIYKKNYQ